MLTKIAFIGIQTGRKSVDIASRVNTASATSDCRKPHEYWCLLSCRVQKGCGSDIGPIIIGREYAMGTSASSMDSALRNLRKIELADLQHGHIFCIYIPAHDQSVESSGGR